MAHSNVIIKQRGLAAISAVLIPCLVTYPLVGHGLSSQAESNFSASPITSIKGSISSNDSLGARLTQRLRSPIGIEETRCHDDTLMEPSHNDSNENKTNIGSILSFDNCQEKEIQDYGTAYPQLKDPGLSGYIGFGYEYVDNPARVSGENSQDNDSSNSFNSSAGLGYQSRVGNLSYRIGGSLSRQNLDDGNTFDSNQYNISAGALYTVNKRLSFGLNWSHDEGRLPRNRRGTRDIASTSGRNDTNEFNIIGGQINIGSSADRLQLNLAASYSDNDYDLTSDSANELFNDIRDNNIENYSASLIYNYSPRTRFFVDTSYAEFDHSGQNSINDPSRDSEQYGANIGMISDLSEKLTFSGKVGYNMKDFDSPLRSDRTINDYNMSLSYRLSPKTTVNLYAASTFEESSFIEASGVESELLGVSVNYELMPNKLYVSGFYNNLDDEFIDSIREDSSEDYGVSVIYKLTEDLSVNIEAGRNTRNSNINIFDYSSESYGLSLNYTFGN